MHRVTISIDDEEFEILRQMSTKYKSCVKIQCEFAVTAYIEKMANINRNARPDMPLSVIIDNMAIEPRQVPSTAESAAVKHLKETGVKPALAWGNNKK